MNPIAVIGITLGRLATLIATNVNRLLAHRQVDSVTEQLRAKKRRQHDSDMEDWGREWAYLLDSGPDQPAEGVGGRPEHHQSVKSES